MTWRWLIGSLLLALVLGGCIVVPAYPVAVGGSHDHRGHHGHHRHDRHGYRGYYR